MKRLNHVNINMEVNDWMAKTSQKNTLAFFDHFKYGVGESVWFKKPKPNYSEQIVEKSFSSKTD